MIRWDPSTRSLTFTMPRMRDLMRRRARVIWATLGFILFLDTLMLFVDLGVAERMAELDESTDRIFQFITKFGDSKYYLVPIVMLLPFVLAARQALEDPKVRRMLGWGALALVFIFVSIAGAGILNNIIKLIIGRTRPSLWFDEGEYGFAPFSFGGSRYMSFPSGHSNTAFALATALGYFWPKGRKYLYAAAALVALSRVVVTAHYLSDVIAGSVLGVLVVRWIYRQFAKRSWVFIHHKGETRVAAPGVLLKQKILQWMHEHLGTRWGARDRLP